MLRKKYWFFIVLWIGFIFSFSLQEAAESSAISNKVTQTIIEHTTSETAEKFDNMSAYELKQFHAAVRKCAHFAEFLILGVLMYLSTNECLRKHKVIVAWILCILVAAIDESIQLFVDGRSGQLSDVLLDSCGSLVGIFLTLELSALFRKKDATREIR